jgi:two-component system, chemotaxis family, protein-glutamate methylesterase/glutaminase
MGLTATARPACERAVDVPNVINPEGQPRDVIVIGASAGGVQALIHLLSRLPGDLPAVVGIVLHRTPYHETQLPYVLGRHSALRTIEPEDGAELERGVAYVAPRDQHLLFEKDRVRLSRGPREHMTRPAADPLFRSAVSAFGSRVVGVLLTGFGGDGVPGLIEISAAGGLTIAQDPREAAHPTMPRRAIAEDDVDAVLPLDGIASTLVALAHGRAVAGTHAEISR